ncbi:MAG TPA: aldolase [Terriglobia bacterium]|nr:aldolase [Terriglobia bacterium]
MATSIYEVGEYNFSPEKFLPRKLFEAITDVRVDRPEIVLTEARTRRRRSRLTLDGKLVILATDHPGRRVTALGADPLAMGDRHSYLARALRVLTTPGCDGIMGTTDFMEDILIVNALVQESGGASLIDDKVLIGCMNRGGHVGVAGEIDDRFTSFTAKQLKRMNFDGGKMMYRLDPSDERSIKAVSDCAQAVSELYREYLYAFLEPMSVERKKNGAYETVKTVEALVRDAGAAAALGESSSRTFLKLSYTQGYERVARATTLPILMLGGPAREDPTSILKEFALGMEAGANVRGVMVGRNVSFASKEDPGALAAAVCGIVHERLAVEGALERLSAVRGQGMNFFARWQ